MCPFGQAVSQMPPASQTLPGAHSAHAVISEPHSPPVHVARRQVPPGHCEGAVHSTHEPPAPVQYGRSGLMRAQSLLEEHPTHVPPLHTPGREPI
jgi:hypothetical protein